jgi:hypothetical protein
MKILKIADIPLKIADEAAKHGTDKKRRATAGKDALRESHIKIIREKLPGVSRVLCVGARDDSEVLSFQKNGFDAIGVDIAQQSACIVQMDAALLGTRWTGKMDLVYASHSLEHMADIISVMTGIRKVAGMGAFIVLPVTDYLRYGHPVIFDVMVGGGLEEDFSLWKPFEVLHYAFNKVEIEILFKWSL